MAHSSARADRKERCKIQTLTPSAYRSGLLLLIALIAEGCGPTGYYDSGFRVVSLSRHLTGYEWARAEFTFESRLVYPAVVGKPEFLELRLRKKDPYLINLVTWYNPLKGDLPTHDWQFFRSEFTAASKAIGRHRWLARWRAAVEGRETELLILDSPSGTSFDLGQNDARERWRAGGLRGKPAYYLLARGEQGGFISSLAFGPDDDRAVVFFAGADGAFPERHWLDRVRLRTWSAEGSGKINYEYAVIEPSGAWSQQTDTKPLAPILARTPKRTR